MPSRRAQMEYPLSRALFEGEAYIEAQFQVGATLQPNLYICNVSRYVPIRQIVYLDINHMVIYSRISHLQSAVFMIAPPHVRTCLGPQARLDTNQVIQPRKMAKDD